MHFVFCQISNQVINPEAGLKRTISDEYYESLYTEKAKDGYYRPEHFWELPLWIGEATHALSDHHSVSLHVVQDIRNPLPNDYAVPENGVRERIVYCFSVLDVNKDIVQHIIGRNCNLEFALGGYVDRTEFFSDLSAYANSVSWYKSISDLCYGYGVKYEYGLNWALFKGQGRKYRTIPRLTMSYGCSNKCSFCTVSNKVESVSWKEVRQQIGAMQGLDFKLVYLNDKTFGQSDNCIWLESLYNIIKYYNPDFRGFIVQTTCQEVNNRPANFWSHNHVVVVELGIETYNDNLLSGLNKPQSEKTIKAAVQKLSDAGVHVIANIVLGIPGENATTYGKTLGFLASTPFYAFNIYILALYAETELATVLEPTMADGITSRDANELATTKTFWSAQEQRCFDDFSGMFYHLGIAKVKQ